MLKKMVNGIEVDMTPSEETALRKQWDKAALDSAEKAAQDAEKNQEIESHKKRLKVLAAQSELASTEAKEAISRYLKLKLLQDEFKD